MRDESLKTKIANDRQRYLDEPVYVEISKAKPLALAMFYDLAALGEQMPRRHAEAVHPVIRDISHYERVQLRWLKPDGNGALVPKYA